MGEKTRQWETRNPRHTHLLKMPGHNLTSCQMQSPCIILFFNDDLLNKTVIQSNRFGRYKIAELPLTPWSGVSVAEVKSFLGLLINVGLILLPDIKDYCSSERKTQIKLFGDVMSRDRFLQIIWMMHVEK
jgi:hypothetical protein